MTSSQPSPHVPRFMWSSSPALACIHKNAMISISYMASTHDGYMGTVGLFVGQGSFALAIGEYAGHRGEIAASSAGIGALAMDLSGDLCSRGDFGIVDP